MVKTLFLYNYKGQYHPMIPHRLKFGGKWFQHYHPNITYEGGVPKIIAENQAEKLRERGYNARIKRLVRAGGYAVYHRRR